MNKANIIIGYGITLIAIGLAAVIYNPEARELALYWKGKTGLFIAGGGGVLAIVLGLMARSGKNLPHIIAAVLAFLFVCVAFQKGFGTARQVASNQIEAFHWYKATLFWFIFFASLLALLPVLIFLRREKISPDEKS